MRVSFFKKVFDIENYQDKWEPLYSANSDFVVIKKKGFVPYLVEHLGDDVIFAIDEVKYEAKDLFSLRITVHNTVNMFFFYKEKANKEQLINRVQEQLFELQEIDHQNEKEIQSRVISLVNTALEYNPTLGFMDSHLPYITKDLFPKNMVFLIAEEEKEVVVEEVVETKGKKKKNRELSNFIWDSVFSLFSMILLTGFVFIICQYLYKKNAGLAITFIFMSYLEPTILIYDLYTTYRRNKEFKLLSLDKILLFSISVIGIIIGAFISKILATKVFKLESSGLINSFILIASLISVVVLVLSYLVVLFLVKRHLKKDNNKE